MTEIKTEKMEKHNEDLKCMVHYHKSQLDFYTIRHLYESVGFRGAGTKIIQPLCRC